MWPSHPLYFLSLVSSLISSLTMLIVIDLYSLILRQGKLVGLERIHKFFYYNLIYVFAFINSYDLQSIYLSNRDLRTFLTILVSGIRSRKLNLVLKYIIQFGIQLIKIFIIFHSYLVKQSCQHLQHRVLCILIYSCVVSRMSQAFLEVSHMDIRLNSLGKIAINMA